LNATYECICDHGRIVEMAMSDMYDDKDLGMRGFARGVQLIAVAMNSLYVNDMQFVRRFYKWVQGNCRNGLIKPIKATVFRPEEAVNAFHSMTTGHTIGRLIIKFRDEEIVRTPLLAMNRTMNMRTTVKTFFDPNKVYVITGGLGGFGLELIQWMHYRGGRKFVVTSRSGVRTDYQKFIINRLNSVYKRNKNFSPDLLVSTVNGMTIEGTQQLLNEAKELGPIGGVFHLALALRNELLERQTIDDFCATVDTKHNIFAHLDHLSRQLAYELDYFVVFSSVSCGKGNGGQSNYGYGNSLCERICERRRRDGRHGLAVQYGPIGDVGVLASVDQGLGFTAMKKQRIHSCCDVLDKFLAINAPIVTSYVCY
jgi:fatty acid synthase